MLPLATQVPDADRHGVRHESPGTDAAIGAQNGQSRFLSGLGTNVWSVLAVDANTDGAIRHLANHPAMKLW